MPKTRPAYPPEFRSEAVRLIREGGRHPEQLARDLGCSAQTIRNWIRQADLDAGRRSDGLTTSEREELTRKRQGSDNEAQGPLRWPSGLISRFCD